MRTVELVGPKGYSHGWVFHGVPGVTSHSDLLKMRTEARAALPQGHPERLKAERAVRHSRKLKGATAKATGDRGEPSGLGPPPDIGIQKYYRSAAGRKSTKAERLLNAEFRPGEGEMLTGKPALSQREQRNLQRQHESLYRKYPGLSWDSFEQNAVDQGYPEGSARYHKEVLRQARAQLEERQAKPEHVNRTERARGRTRAQQRQFEQTNPGESPNPLQRRFAVARPGIAGTPTSEDRALAHVDSRTIAVRGKLTPAERGSLDWYNSVYGYRHINMRARGQRPAEKVFGKDAPGEAISSLDSAFRKVEPIDHTIQLHRGLEYGVHDLFGEPGSAVGKTVQDKGFVSTTTHAGIANRWSRGGTDSAVLHLAVPKGTHALSTEPFKSGYEGDRTMNEVLLPRNANIRIIRDRTEGGVRHLHGVVSYAGGSKATGTTTTSLSGKRGRRVDLVGPKGYVHGWIKVGPGTAKFHGKTVVGADRHFREVHGVYDHRSGTVIDTKRGEVPVHYVSGGLKKQRRPLGWRPKLALGFSIETPRLVATPAPLGKPGGPGLYHLKGAKLPNYIENMRNALMRSGMKEGRATATAISRCKVLALTSKHPEVKAAAAAAIAELKATAARAKAVHGHANDPYRIVELFNPFHAPAGPGGGRFTSKSGASGGAQAKAAKGPRFGPSGQNFTARSQQKAAILKQVRVLRQRISAQEVTLGGLKAQRQSLTLSVGGSKAKGTTKAAKAKKTATKKSKTTTKTAKGKTTARKTTQAAAKKAATINQIGRLSTQISQLQNRIAGERSQVRSLVAKARTL